MHLTLHDHGVDDTPHVVGTGHRNQVDDARLGVDLHFGHVSPGRVGKVLRIVEGRLLEARLQALRIVVRHVGRQRHVGETQRLIGARHGEASVLEDDVGLGGLHEVGCDLDALLDDLLQGLVDGRPTHRHRARAIRAHAEGHLGGITVNDLDLIDPDAQALGHDLGEGSLMALPSGL